MIAHEVAGATPAHDTPSRIILLSLPNEGVDVFDPADLTPYLATPLGRRERIAGLVMTEEGMAVRVTVAAGEAVSV